MAGGLRWPGRRSLPVPVQSRAAPVTDRDAIDVPRIGLIPSLPPLPCAALNFGLFLLRGARLRFLPLTAGTVGKGHGRLWRRGTHERIHLNVRRCAKPVPNALGRKPVPSSESQLLFGLLAAARARILSSIL